ncbi:Dehydrogenase/reductase SDR family member 12 [Portunus trituberculatus]|uniref:Dehydrogenase/reductase SDR family member 12 n=1 Tax=Portunus trituberculatus TaxID=210409 RepID=A0A5B7EJT5_PORTR|nr:Dehydrogenase/reductase SDR family member 12 [Portunus trituberculatus]
MDCGKMRLMKDNLRTPAQGADTVVWLAISKAALKHPSGLFFQDREPVSTHFPLAWTKSSIEEEDILMNNIQEIYSQIYNKVMAGASVSPTTEPPPPPPASAEPQATDKGQEEEILPHPLATESEAAKFPVLPPPPPPAEKIVPVKSEVEVAEIHAPPLDTNEDTSNDTSNTSEEQMVERREGEGASEEDSSEENNSKDAKPAVEEREPAETTKPEETKETKESEAISSPLERTEATGKETGDKKEELQDVGDDSSSASIEQGIPEP